MFLKVQYLSQKGIIGGGLFFIFFQKGNFHTMKIMIVTANENETKAVLACKSFNHKVNKSNDQYDVNFYNVGKWATYDVIHFQLPMQGANGADSSALSLASAINNFEPNAVILLGIAFGKDNKDDKNRTQNIGDVLISERVADYESGKVRNGSFIPTVIYIQTL